MKTQWGLPARHIAAVLLLIFFIYVLYLMGAIVQLLIIAALIAFILAPLIRSLHETLHLPKGLAVLVAYILLIIIIIMAPLLIVPSLVEAFQAIDVNVITLAEQVRDWSLNTLNAYREIVLFGMTIDLSPVVDNALDALSNIRPAQFVPSLDRIIAALPSTVEITWGVASNFFGTVVTGLIAFALTLLYSIYMSIGTAEKYGTTVMAFIPKNHQPELVELGQRLRDIWNAYFIGQLNLGIIIGLITWLTGTMIGLPGSFALGVIAGVLEILPGLGPFLAALPALIVALVQGSDILSVNNFTFMLIVLAQYVLIQQVENNIIVPKILGDAVELDPIVVMVGVVVGASVGGILGALIAAPTIASARTIILYTYAKILDEDPFPPTEDKREDPFTITGAILDAWNRVRIWIDQGNQAERPAKKPRKNLKP